MGQKHLALFCLSLRFSSWHHFYITYHRPFRYPWPVVLISISRRRRRWEILKHMCTSTRKDAFAKLKNVCVGIKCSFYEVTYFIFEEVKSKWWKLPNWTFKYPLKVRQCCGCSQGQVCSSLLIISSLFLLSAYVHLPYWQSLLESKKESCWPANQPFLPLFLSSHKIFRRK